MVSDSDIKESHSCGLALSPARGTETQVLEDSAGQQKTTGNNSAVVHSYSDRVWLGAKLGKLEDFFAEHGNSSPKL